MKIIMQKVVHDLDSLRKLVRELQCENQELRELLKREQITIEESRIFSDNPVHSREYDPDQGSRITNRYIDNELAKRFFGMFWGREDVFARRGKKGGYFPQCHNRWEKRICPKERGEKIECSECAYRKWEKLDVDIIKRHLIGYSEMGTDVIGVYPILQDSSCRFLVFDFDNHEKGSDQNDNANQNDDWLDEVDALRVICKENGIQALVERSRSGKGAHVWIFFQKPIPAQLAREFGELLLEKGMTSINLKSFRYYDRMIPNQDEAKHLGNLIALPLQGFAIKSGNSAFVDENWNAYPNQWEHLLGTKKMFAEEIEGLVSKWQQELYLNCRVDYYTERKNRQKPWKRSKKFEYADVIGKLHIVLADGIYIDTLNIKPRLQNQIRCLATFDNPVFYKNKRSGFSNYYNYSTVYMGRDVDGYIQIPRGLLADIIKECNRSRIEYDIEEQYETGNPIRATFLGELKMQQTLAANQLLAYDNGVLKAATAFGKTVVCSYLISQKRVNTLILLERTDLLYQWEEELNKFLQIDEKPPTYKTKTGRIKVRSSVIGTLVGGKDKTTGIIDIAMIGSLYKKGEFHERINSYGMVIMDECHHAASHSAQEVLKRINAKFVYGVSATPMRSDNLERINYMLLGPIRHEFTALDRAQEQGIDHLVYPRYTRLINYENKKMNNYEAYSLISGNKVRNDLIISDVKECVKNGRTPVVLTRFKEQAKVIHDSLVGEADHVFILYGDNTIKENVSIREQLNRVPQQESLILVATGQKIGEGFSCARLDTLMLAAPVSYGGRLEQYVGRINRDYQGKESVIVYDYIDTNIQDFANAYSKRLKTYKKIGFSIITSPGIEKQNTNAIYDSHSYVEIFERDLVEAERDIVISSPAITWKKVERLIHLMKVRQEAGVAITIITCNPEASLYQNSVFQLGLIATLKDVGIKVIIKEEVLCFSVIDQYIVWHGGMNLLGKEDIWDNLMRIKDASVAMELMETVESEE